MQSEGSDKRLSLTVYNNDLALIEHIRAGSAPQGIQRIEILREDGVPARVIFDKVPDNLRASPTLSVLANMAPRYG